MGREYNVLLFALAAGLLNQQVVAAEKDGGSVKVTPDESAVLWRNPQDLSSRNLFYGRGGEQHQPVGDCSFLKEDMGGSNPKFVVRDAKGVTWNVKLGIEARPEVVASRLVWAAGYSADEDYFVHELHVTGLPARLQRGQKFEEAGGNFRNVRLKRTLNRGEKAGHWKWRQNPFVGTREFNGLRVLVAVINDWDVKDVNTAIREQEDEDGRQQRVFLISDLGASFGTAGIVHPRWKSKGDLTSYRSSTFIRRTDPEVVDFETPRRAPILFLVNPHVFFSRLKLRWVGRDIPRADARWTGELLARLSASQIRDAFRAAGYSPEDVEGFAQVLTARIEALNGL
jgi:hypothetical protein